MLHERTEDEGELVRKGTENYGIQILVDLGLQGRFLIGLGQTLLRVLYIALLLSYWAAVLMIFLSFYFFVYGIFGFEYVIVDF